jgi:hypothetical protein
MERDNIRSVVTDLIGETSHTEDIVNSIFYSDLLCRYFDNPKAPKSGMERKRIFATSSLPTSAPHLKTLR